MKIVNTKFELNNVLKEFRKKSSEIGYIPTMGALHLGHGELIKRSIDENDFTVVSIFVNQLQFSNIKDFENYPSKIDIDIEYLKNLDCDLVFIPNASEMFPKVFRPIHLNIDHLERVLEGPNRPGHFEGVIQVVYQFFKYIQPDRAYFGLKDYQQCLVIKELKTKYFSDISLVFCPTYREISGLAMSSRNERLSDAGRLNAANIYKTLEVVQALSKHIESKDALVYGKYILNEKNIKVEYLELSNSETLIHSKKWLGKGKNALLIAAYIEKVRLIDNIIF